MLPCPECGRQPLLVRYNEWNRYECCCGFRPEDSAASFFKAQEIWDKAVDERKK